MSEHDCGGGFFGLRTCSVTEPEELDFQSPNTKDATMHEPPQSVRDGVSFDLDGIDQELRQEERYDRAGQVARTLVRTADLRIVMIVAKAGNQIAEHQANETASIQVLSGRIHLMLPSRSVELGSGQLIVLESGLRHSVDVMDDCAFLLTLGWTKSAGTD